MLPVALASLMKCLCNYGDSIPAAFLYNKLSTAGKETKQKKAES